MPKILKKMKNLVSLLFWYPKYERSGHTDYEDYWAKTHRNPKTFAEQIGSTKFCDVVTHLQDNCTLLDIGSGDGKLFYFAKDKIKQFVGCDISHAGIAQAQAHYASYKKASFYVRDVTKEGLAESEIFDHIVLLNLLEHIPNPEELFEQIVEHFNHSILFTIPNTGYWIHRFRLLLGRFPVQYQFYPGEHLRYWTVKDLVHWFEKSLGPLSLKITKIKGYNGPKGLLHLCPSVFAASLFVVVQKRVQSQI